VKKLAPDAGAQVEGITARAIEKLEQYAWPGNVRELENVIERSLVMARGTMLDADDIRLETARQFKAVAGDFALPSGMTLDQYEQEIIKQALKRRMGIRAGRPVCWG
jgi:DNA-binding NtrC family response regulator